MRKRQLRLPRREPGRGGLACQTVEERTQGPGVAVADCGMDRVELGARAADELAGAAEAHLLDLGEDGVPDEPREMYFAKLRGTN